MNKAYDNYYQTENLFGEPSPEMIAFFAALPTKGKVLDLGCGQGRDAIALARLGFAVTGIDSSAVGIEQMNQIAHAEKLDLVGEVGDIHAFDRYDEFDYILLDSMFHFAKNDLQKEVGLLQHIASDIRSGSRVVVLFQDKGENVHILYQALEHKEPMQRIVDEKFKYVFEDQESGHKSTTDYRMVVVKK